MTTQPRGLPSQPFQPSPSQPIPGRYSNQQQNFSPSQAYSPRHVVPSSSPHQSAQYYQQPGLPLQVQPHEIYKGPGVAGTPPMMQQSYFNGGRQGAPMPGVHGGSRFYPYRMPRYTGMQGPTGPPAAYQYASQAQYPQFVPHGQPMAHQPQMYSPSGYQQYPPPPTQQQLGPPQVQQMMSQQPHQASKREKRIIRIVDPATNQDVTEDIIKSQRQESLSTPPSGRSSATPPTQVDVAAKFAAQVAVAAGTSKSASPHVPTPSDPVMINQNAQLMQQMPPDPVVGSPGMMMPQQIVNIPAQSSSPRPPSVPPQSQPPVIVGQQYAQMQTGQPSVPSSQMLASSPGHAAASLQHSQIALASQIHEQLQHTGFQTQPPQQTQQFAATSLPPTRPMTTNIPENAFSSRTGLTNLALGDPGSVSQPQQTQISRQMNRPHVPIQQPPQQSSQPVSAVQTVTPAITKAIPDQEPIPLASEQVSPDDAPSPPEAPSISHQTETGKSISSAKDGKPIAEEDAVEPQEQPEVAFGTEKAAITPEVLAGDGPAKTPEPLIKTAAEMADIDNAPVDRVPSMPEKTEQAPVKEDTAIRLEEQDSKIVQSAAEEPQISEVVKDVSIPQQVTETATEGERKADVPSSPPASNMESAKPEVTPSVNIVPATPPSKGTLEQQTEEQLSAVPTKGDKVKAEDVVESKAKYKVTEKQAGRSRVKSPESQKPQTSDLGKTSRKESSSSDKQQKPTVSKTPSSQKLAEKTVVNGLDSSTGSDAGKEALKSDDASQSVKPVKMTDVKSTTDSKLPQSKVESERSSPVVSDKTSSEKGKEFEKTNGVCPGKSNKQLSDIKYDDDQWSPLNPKGKRQYDSNFLLQFQYRPTSLEKPKDLPNIDIVLEQPHNKIATAMQPMEIRAGADFTPSYMNKGPPRRPGRQNSRDHRMGRSSMGVGQRVIQKVVSIDRDVELKTTENAWKPIRRDKNMGKMPAEEMETMEVIRDVRAILNKLTPSTFTTLMQQVLALKIDTERKLRGTIDLIFEKAIDEPNFSEAYANMCRQMTAIRVTPTEPTGAEQSVPTPPTVEFRKLLLTKCQREFEKNKSDQEHLSELKKKMEENEDPELAPQMKEEYEIAETKERRRTLGNIRFIGELFKLRMLTESIMHSCIMTLFKARDDDHLESLCRLLTTIGKDLDHPKGKQRMDQYFDQIMKIIQEKRTSARVRFMLQDVHDLRLNNWVPRAIATQGPKTISQIHQDAKQEQELLELKLATTAAPPPMKQGGRQQNRMGSRGHGEDGWTKVQTPAKPTRYDPNKMKLKPNQFDETKVTLGPSRGFMGWKSGSAGSGLSKTGSGGYSPSGSMDRTQESGRSNTPTSMKNRFSALSQGQGPDYDSQRRQPGRQSSRDGSRTGSRGSMGPPSSSSSGGRTPRRDERTSVLEAARKLTSTDRSSDSRQRPSRESSPSVRQRPSTPQQQQPVHTYNTALNEEKMQQKSKIILEEFLDILDFKEATECIEELNAPPSIMYALVQVAHEFTLEKKKEARVHIGRLMAHLLKRGRLSVEQYMKGLAELLEMGSDYEIDVPKVWEYFADQLSPVFEDEKETDMPLARLAELASPLREEGKSGIFVAEVVKAITKRAPMEDFVQRWQRSNMQWNSIIGKNDGSVEKFLAEHNLSELSDSRSFSKGQSGVWLSNLQQTPAEEQSRLEKAIMKLLDDNVPNDDIFSWVDGNVEKENLVKPPFLRALTIAICSKALDTKDEIIVVEDRISDRGIVLKRYVDADSDRELQTLYALQQLMVDLDQPANVLRKFFDVLYNEDVVSEQTFYKWEASDDPNEQEGRGVAVASVNPFFTWLRTAELESD